MHIRTLVNECVPKNYFSYFSSKTYVMGTQKNRLNETVFEHPKHMFLFVCLFDLILYISSTILQLNRDGSSWV